MLWFGELTDFGDFRSALSRGAAKDSRISFSFEVDITINKIKKWDIENGYPYFTHSSYPDILPCKIDISYVNAKVGSNDISQITIYIFDHTIELQFDRAQYARSIVINGQQMLRPESLVRGNARGGTIPQLTYFRTRKGKDDVLRIFSELPEFKYSELISNISEEIRQGVTIQYKRKIVAELNLDSKLGMLQRLRRSTSKLIANRAQGWSINNEDFLNLINRYLYLRLDDYLEAINSEFKDFFGNLRYIAPLRASADRYYRTRNLSIDEIDHDGSNMAIVFRSFTKKERESFNEWLLKNFNFTISVHNAEGHISVKIKESDDDFESNLSDTGFGYSQILPIITQMWLILNQIDKVNRRQFGFVKNSYTVVIEQPELHLHPAMQAMFIDAMANLVDISKQRDFDFKCIIETHSETMINRLSQLSRADSLDIKDVALYIFEKDSNGITSIRRSSLTDNGTATNWPIGFFLPRPLKKSSRPIEINESQETKSVNSN